MPTYEYQCKVCKHLFEVFQAITDKPVRKCLVCGGEVKRLIGPGAGLIFKGSGFYITDYKKKESSIQKYVGSEEKKENTEQKKREEVPKDKSEKKSSKNKQ